MLQPAGTRPVLRAASPHCGLGPVAGLTLPQIHPAITPRPTAHSAFSTVWSPSVNKLQCTDRRRKAQRREARQRAQGQSQDRPNLFRDLQGAPTSLPAQASSLLLLSHCPCQPPDRLSLHSSPGTWTGPYKAGHDPGEPRSQGVNTY